MKTIRQTVLAFGTSLMALASSTQAEVKLASFFSDHMVIQRDQPVHIWGTAGAGDALQIKLADQSAQATADASGQWSATLAPLPVGGPYQLSVSDGTSSTQAKDVLSGDIWLCSGQSNMQMNLSECDDGAAVAQQASQHPLLRLCYIQQAWTDTPQSTAKADWKPATPESASHFAAVGYYFAHELQNDPAMANVPIGLIESSVGGTMAEAWTPKTELDTLPNIHMDDSMLGIKPTTLYNGMIAPLRNLSIKGTIWYQGESNAGQFETYAAKLTALIHGWRKQFESPQLPFVIVQLPDFIPAYNGYYWQWERDAQQQVAKTVPNTFVVTTIHTTDGHDLHPKQKHEVGRRVALLIRQAVYHESVPGHGPIFADAQANGHSLRVRFDTDGSTLSASNPSDVKGFFIAGSDGEYRAAAAKIDGNSVVLTNDAVPEPKTVRYAWSGVPDSTLTNAEGLPAYPFRTDMLPPDTFGMQEALPSKTIGAKDYQITIAEGGRVSSFVVKGRELISNEAGLSGGAFVPSLFGPRNLNRYQELGPDLIQIGDNEVHLQFHLATNSVRWTLDNQGNGPIALRMALSPLVKVSSPQQGKVTLTRPGATIHVTNVDHVDNSDTGPVLNFKAQPHQTETIAFEFE